MWIEEQCHENIPVNWGIIKQCAKDFAPLLGVSEGELEFSNGWIDRFRKRFRLGVKRLHGEGSSADVVLAAAKLLEI